jgi:glycine cleavage system aminomethyltransferase T
VDWDAWAYGELSFPAGGLEKWKTSRPSTSAWSIVPSWLRPNLAADARTSTTLASLKSWESAQRQYVRSPDAIAARTLARSVSLRAYLTGAWFSHFAGQLVALTLAGASFGARGELVVVDMRTARGYRLRTDGAGPLIAETVDAADAADADLVQVKDDARRWLEGAASVVLPSMSAPHPERGMADILDSVRRDVADPRPSHALGGVAEANEIVPPSEYGDGVDAEVARARTSCAVFDLSHAAELRVSYNEPEAFLLELTGRSTQRAAEVDLVDPRTGAFADRALVVPLFGASRLLRGSAMGPAYLHDWLRARAAEQKGKAPTLQLPTLWGGALLAFVGPDAARVAGDVLGERDTLASMGEGDFGPGSGNAEFIACATRHGLPAVWAWINRTKAAAVGERCRSLLAGARAEQRLDVEAGLRPRPRWTGAHVEPWTTGARIEIPIEQAAGAAVKTKSATAAKRPKR